jgi:uncharacterized protein (TIGR00299 family) protein
MKIAYIDCISGISGDMMLGALVDAGVNLEDIQRGIDSLGLPDCKLARSEVKKKGFRATHIDVNHPPEHAHRHLHHITEMIDRSLLTDSQKDLAKRIFTRLGQAEAKVHGTSIEKVHFHEVGAVDSIADIVGTAIGWDLLQIDHAVCSPIPTGTGQIKIAHGLVTIPAPATAELLVGVPTRHCEIEMELTTPTGAAIATTLANQFGAMPGMAIDQIGYGAGDRDLEQQANVMRLLIGQNSDNQLTEQILVLETNLDDVTGEVIGHCTIRLLESGALDVYTTPIQMKKQRPANTLTVLCEIAQAATMESIIFRETGTLGIRRWEAARTKLARKKVAVTTQWGKITGKLAILPDQTTRFSAEYDNCARIAREQNLPVQQVIEQAQLAWIKQAENG